MVQAQKQTKQDILDLAAKEVKTKGFTNTSFNDLIKLSGLSKGAFYYYFKSKQDLLMALIDIYYEQEVELEWISRFKTPLNTINVLLKAIENKMKTYYESGDYRYGSVLNNLLHELSAVDPAYQYKLFAVFESWTELTAKYIRRGQKFNYVKNSFDSKSLANYFIHNNIAILNVLKISGDYSQAFNMFKQLRKSVGVFRAD
ncbi:MAG: TetR/AcrR family transcriptional regulator [Candidatus Caenarcaniphilales bacterium]|nr:TetR/AcrR family transcriptional regulator [Candidatus Caenarcaniphilales bacterium]